MRSKWWCAEIREKAKDVMGKKSKGEEFKRNVSWRKSTVKCSFHFMQKLWTSSRARTSPEKLELG